MKINKKELVVGQFFKTRIDSFNTVVLDYNLANSIALHFVQA